MAISNDFLRSAFAFRFLQRILLRITLNFLCFGEFRLPISVLAAINNVAVLFMTRVLSVGEETGFSQIVGWPSEIQ